MTRLIDISAPLQAGIASDPPEMLPTIEYMDHHMTAPRLAAYFGVRPDQLPEGQYAAIERCTISTHNGTHVDAPYHYFSRMNEAVTPGGVPSMRIDEVPLEWLYQPGVKLDFRHMPDGTLIQPADIEAELTRIGHTLRPMEIVVANTRAGQRYGEADYIDSGCGFGRAATLWLVQQGIRVVGTDAWSWDAPFSHTRRRVAGDGGCRADLGGAPRGTGPRVLPDREAAQPRGAAGGRVHDLGLPGEGASGLGWLDPRGGDPAGLTRIGLSAAMLT